MKEVRALVNATSANSDYIFISYSHKDKKYVMEDMQELAKNGVVFWYDNGLDSGDNWEQKVKDVINNKHCKGIIFYVSKNFLLSQAIIKEVNLLNERLKHTPGFKYFPVFITIKSVYNTLRELEVSEKDFLTLLQTFPSNLIYHSKTYNKFSHIEKLTEELKNLGVVQSRFIYDSRTNFKTKKHVIKNISGLKIVKYEGMEKNLLIPAYLNGEKIISIGYDCFHGNDNVESIVLPEGLIEICDMAFKECSSLKYISIPTTLEHIGYEAFRDCASLESTVFPSKINYVGDYCFYRCHRLINVIFNTTEKVLLGYAAFSECISLKELKLPKKISEFGSYCFNCCDSLEGVVLPREIDAVGDYIFLNCGGLDRLYIKTETFFEVKNIFENCVNLNKIVFSTDNFKIFYDEPQWQEYKDVISIKLSSPGHLEINKQGIIWWDRVDRGDVYEVTIKASDGTVQEIETSNCYLEDYKFKENNTYYISVKAFSSASDYIPSDPSKELRYDYNLTQFDIYDETNKLVRYKRNGEKRIKIPNEIKIIGKNAFEEACDVEEIVLGDNVETIEDEAFIRCRNLKRVVFNNKLKEIKASAFAYCTKLESITFNKGFMKLGEFAFACCDELQRIDFSASIVKEIPKRCFYRCIKLNNIVWNNTITAFKNSAFRGCSICEFTQLPPNLESIDETVFSFNTGLKRVELPSCIKYLASDFLWYTINVEEVTISGSEKFFTEQGVLFDALGTLIYYPVNSKIKNYACPMNCNRISPTSFSDCTFLEQADLENVETIEHNNFDKCKMLKRVIFGNSIKLVENNCFNNCNALKEIVFMCDHIPMIGESCFLNCNEELSLIMSKNLLEQVKKSKSWKRLLKNLQDNQCPVKMITE